MNIRAQSPGNYFPAINAEGLGFQLPRCRPSERGLTLIDVLIVVATIAIAAGLLLPRSSSGARGPRISCVNNLKQVGLAYRMWANDHGDQFPWAAPGTNGGTLELATSGNVVAHFLTASNEMNTPRILACPSDDMRTKAIQFDSNFSSANISYFIGLEAEVTSPQSILSGDRNLTTNGVVRSGMLIVQDVNQLTWTSAIHQSAGNLGLVDGSAQQLTTRSLQKQFEAQAKVPARIILP